VLLEHCHCPLEHCHHLLKHCHYLLEQEHFHHLLELHLLQDQDL
jgi:hypothetical protein